MTETLQRRIRGSASYVDIDESQRPAFQLLRSKLGVNNPYSFAIAAALGSQRNNRSTAITRSGSGWARLDDFNSDNGLEMLCMAIGQWAGEDPLDFRACWKAAEEYAAGGLTLLQNDLNAPGDFRERFAALIRERLDELVADVRPQVQDAEDVSSVDDAATGATSDE